MSFQVHISETQVEGCRDTRSLTMQSRQVWNVSVCAAVCTLSQLIHVKLQNISIHLPLAAANPHVVVCRPLHCRVGNLFYAGTVVHSVWHCHLTPWSFSALSPNLSLWVFSEHAHYSGLINSSWLKVQMRVCLFLYVGPMIDWWAVIGVSPMSPLYQLGLAPPPCNPAQISGIDNGWMDLILNYCFSWHL